MVRKIARNFRKKNNAFGSVVSTLILFIAVVGVSTGLVIAFKNYISDTQTALNVQNDVTSNKLKSAISITNIYYNSTSNQTFIYVKNIGQLKLYTKNFDLFVDNLYSNNFSSVYASNLSKSLILLNPFDTMAIIYNKSIVPGTHNIRVVTAYSSYAEDTFNN